MKEEKLDSCGLRITRRRVRTGLQKIDLSAVNVSLDSRLWEKGAYILIECKNWSGRVGIEVIRSLVHICAYKGNRTVFLFADRKWEELLDRREEGTLL